MKNILLLFVIILFLGSCERPYDGEKRLVVEGQLVDQNQNPISNELVEIYIGESPTIIFGLGTDLISYGKTDADGRFKLAFPSPKNNELIEISIEDYYQNGIYQPQSFIANIEFFTNFRLNIGTIKLFRQQDITAFKIVPVQVTPNSFISEVLITALQPSDRIVDLRNPLPNGNNSSFQTDYQVLKNQTFNINYKLSTSGTVTNKSVVVSVTDQPLTYTLNY